jgi:hypothetical protein
MVFLTSVEEGFVVYDFNQSKSLSFIYGGNTDCYIKADIYSEGTLEEDKSLMFVIDKSNNEFYNAFNNFFKTIEKIVLELKTGQRSVYFPPFKREIECHNWYDINELYDEEKKQIRWSSEAGSGPNKDTIMIIEGYNGGYKIVFKNDEIIKYNDRYPRNVCICNSGSKSDIFPYLYWDFFQKLKELPVTMSYSEAETKILRK